MQADRAPAWVAPLAAAAGEGLVLVVLAFAIAPRSCEGGLDIYFWCGVLGLATVLALPFVVRTGSGMLARVGWALGLGAFAVAAWVAGLVIADVQILCRLF